MTGYSLNVSDRTVCHMIDLITGLWLCICHAYGNILSASFVRKGQDGLFFEKRKAQNLKKSNSINSSVNMFINKTGERDDDVN